MNIKELSIIKKIQLEMMDAIHQVCVDNGIRYYITAGSALGSVRHKGFIPWDIDIDIAMPRSDYGRFKKECAGLLPSSMYYVDYTTEHDFHAPHALVVKKNTRMRRAKDKKWIEGIFVDIFPLDNVPNDVDLQKKQAECIKSIKSRKSYALASKQWSTEPGFFKKVKKLLALPWALCVSVDKLNKKMDDEMRRYDDDDSCTNCCSMASGYTYEKQNMPKAYYGEPKLMEFEGRFYFGPEKPHEYLTKLYKDYMKLPDVKTQEAVMGYFDKVEIN